MAAEQTSLSLELVPMKPRSYLLWSAFVLAGSLLADPLVAAVITVDTTLDVTNTALDGLDLVVSNAVLRVDGPHAFNSLHVAAGATLTHTAAAGGTLPFAASVTNEVQTLTDTNPVTLGQPDIVLASVLVRDTNNIVTYTNDVDYSLIGVGAYLYLQRTATSLIPDGDTVFVSYDFSAATNSGLNLTLTNDFELEPGAQLNVDGRGYAAGTGAGGSGGGPTSGGGGGHGGNGGLSSSNSAGGGSYDSASAPTSLGSGGGNGSGGSGGLGGGAVRLIVGGNCLLNGTVAANGLNATNSRAGGGSGGSIWITAQTISGAGTLSVRGGAGEPIHGGGGAGGRIALAFQTNLFVGAALVNGGAGGQRGGAGTLYFESNAIPQTVTMDNDGFAGAATPLSLPGAAGLIVQGRANVTVALPQSLTSLLVRSNSTVTTAATNNATLTLFINGPATVEDGALLTVSGRGSTPGVGTGVGAISSFVGSGAGHGGYGGSGISGVNVAAGGMYHGSITSPTTFGSGGRSVALYSGGSGGGAVRLNINGKLQLDGRISADAAPGNASLGGGGAGGSVWLTLGTFAGTGTISANGGNGGTPGNGGGGGGGGRIAVTFNTNLFTGNLTAFGGNGGVPGGAGTVYTKQNSATYADLRYDNNGRAGTNAMLDISISCNLVVTGAAALRTPYTSTMFFGSIDVATNSSFAFNNTGGGVNVSSNLTVAAGGWISADGLGSASGSGTGPGQVSSGGSGGAGHGGFGGRGIVASGGNAYGNSANPSSTGSGGGGTSSTGGAGGGSALISCSGICTVNGRISANGASTSTNNAGGGSGGTVRLSLNEFTGTGNIAADGGTGHLPNGGGGGGGRIAITWTTNSFTGSFSAKGGLGYNPGGAGTIYLRPYFGPYPSFIVDNGGVSNSNSVTMLDVSSTIISNLTISGGGRLIASNAVPSSFTLRGNLTIGSNSVLLAYGTFTVWGSAIIASGGAIVADGSGTTGTGFGHASSLGSGGGGHGGYGGRGLGGVGGNIFDSTTTPSQSGCPGGGFGQQAPGGGYLHLNVTGPVTVDGKISANGFGPANLAVTNPAAGGGSGGSVWLETGSSFSGSGSISADGGPGSGISGGGGGGRIAITYFSNAFAGTISAKGGSGYQAGGAGTIFTRRAGDVYASLIVDNGGLSGTNTMLELTYFDPLTNLTITGGAILRPPGPSTIYLVNLLIGSNSSLQMPTSGGALTLNIAGAATVAASGSISTDGQGSPSGNGTGLGGTSSSGSGGGAYGGYGGRGADAVSGRGGNAYGSISAGLAGSGGGGVNASGGAGGGAVRITAYGPFVLDGRISANGLNTYSNNAGGGSGGSIYLTLGQLLGNGTITADGGDGHLPNGGGGGGGRIAVSYLFTGNQNQSNGFVGTLSAKGGNGYQRGGAGTVWLRTNNASTPVVFVDNGGARGTNTLVIGTGGYDLFVSRGAIATSIGAPCDLFVRSNSFLAQSGSVTISRNATFDAGGGINLDGLGNSTAGNGTISSSPKGGAGHGGYGALNTGSSGAVYDFATTPQLSGSQGGNGSGSSGAAPFGGTGGGAVHLNVGSTLTVNGELSADGLNGDLNSGGGSGGALWLTTATLTGNGQITATGGAGNGTAGGGAGGRIAIYYTSNLFAGAISACGGTGALPGGAGTIFWQDNLQHTSLLLDNCGLTGTNTPISAASGVATNVTVTGGAIAEFTGAIPPLSNLVVGAGSGVTTRSTDTNLYLAVLGDLTVSSGARIFTDGKGFIRGAGTGAGATLSNKGAGGGYGGAGGASASGAVGGGIYGSAAMPVDRGSGGGTGLGPLFGSEGGGAIRLAVAGTLALDGMVSANGATGIQDDSGGGAGGSVWITAGQFTGAGALAANGGDGDLFGGGGGGGGRIAIYSPMNTFTGVVAVAGGVGALNGSTGTVFTASSLPGFATIAQTPLGAYADAPTQITVEFSDAVDPASVTPDDFAFYTPNGLLASSNMAVSFPAPATVNLRFASQNVPGNYRLETGPNISSLFAVPMSQVFTGAFSATMPMISGTITNANGAPVAGATLQPSGGLFSTVTDANGNYSLGVPTTWYGTITPVLGDYLFVPGARNYGGLNADVPGQNYLMVSSITPTVGITGGGTNLFLNWSSYPGVTYQVYYATNLSDGLWYPLGDSVVGTNTTMQIELPVSDEPEKYFKLNAQN